MAVSSVTLGVRFPGHPKSGPPLVGDVFQGLWLPDSWNSSLGLHALLDMCVCACVLTLVQLFAIPWTVAHQASLSMGFPRQEYWSGLPFSTPEDLPNPGIEPASFLSPALQADALTSEPPGKPIVNKKTFISLNLCVASSVWMAEPSLGIEMYSSSGG